MEYNKKLSTTPNAYDTSQDKLSPTPTAPPQLHLLQNNHPLFLVPRNYSNTLAVADYTSQDLSYPQSPISQTSALHQSTNDDT